jgi:nucleoside-triphosphatase
LTKSNLLITGKSGVGKSSLLKKVAAALSHRKIRGFLSEAVMENGRRSGWRLENLSGEGDLYIHKSIQSPQRLGGLGVELGLLERLAESELRAEAELYLVDEIARTGAWSEKFMDSILALLDSGNLVIAAIHTDMEGKVGEIRRRQDCDLWELTTENRDEMPAQVLAWIDERLGQGVGS